MGTCASEMPNNKFSMDAERRSAVLRQLTAHVACVHPPPCCCAECGRGAADREVRVWVASLVEARCELVLRVRLRVVECAQVKNINSLSNE